MDPKPAQLHEHAALIDGLGGAIHVCYLMRLHWGVLVGTQTISNWRTRGVPKHYRREVAHLLVVNGQQVPGGFLLARTHPIPQDAAR